MPLYCLVLVSAAACLIGADAIAPSSSTPNNRDGALEKKIVVGIVAPRVQHDFYNEGLNLAIRDLNAEPPPLGYTVEVVNLTGLDETTCTGGEVNYAFLSYALNHTKRPINAVIDANHNKCDPTFESVSHTVIRWDVVRVNVHPGEFHESGEKGAFTVAPSRFLIHRAVAQFAKLCNWQEVGVIGKARPDEKEHVRDLIHELNIEKVNATEYWVFQSVNETIQDEDEKNMLRKIQESKLRIIVSFMDDAVTVVSLLCKAHKLGMISSESGYVWLLTDHVYRHAVEELSEERNRNESCSYDDLIEALDGTVSLRFSFYPQDDEYLKQRLLTGKTREDVITKFNSSQCWDAAERRNWSSCLTLPHKELAGLVYDALTALLYLYNTSSDDTTAGNLERLNKTKASFAGVMGEVRYLDMNESVPVEIVYHDCSKKIGECGNDTEWRSYANGSVVPNSNKWPGGGEKPIDKPVTKSTPYSKSRYIVLAFFLSLGMLMSIVFFCFTIYYREARIIRLSGPYLTMLSAIGSFIGFLSLLIWGIDERFFAYSASLSTCYVRIIGLNIGYVIAISANMLKTWRMRLTLVNENRKRQRRRRRSSALLAAARKESGSVILAGIFVVLNLLLLTSWLGKYPFELHEENIKSLTTFKEEAVQKLCTRHHHLFFLSAAFNCLLMLFALFLAWDARKLTIAFISNPRLNFAGVFTSACLLVAFLIVISSVRVPLDWEYVLLATIGMILFTALLLVDFLPKVYAVVFRKKEGVTGLGKVRGRERASMSDHCILGAQSVAALKRQNGYFKEVIQMLIEERNLCDATVDRIRREIVDVPVTEVFESEDWDEDETTAGSRSGSTSYSGSRKVSFAVLDSGTAGRKTSIGAGAQSSLSRSSQSSSSSSGIGCKSDSTAMALQKKKKNLSPSPPPRPYEFGRSGSVVSTESSV